MPVRTSEGDYAYIDFNTKGMDFSVGTLQEFEFGSIDIIPVVIPEWRDREQHSYFALFTCVEAVKRALNIRKWWIITPHQLYKYLTKEKT